MFRRPTGLLQVSRRTLLAAAPALVFADAASAQATGLLRQTPEEQEREDYVDLPLDAWTDVFGRPTAKVMLDGQGPFRFLVDTGSTTSVLAARHAAKMKLPVVGTATVNGTTGT